MTYMPGYTAPALPYGWAEEDDGLHCLACQREEAVEQAMSEREAQGKSQGWRTKTDALIGFELRRDPSRTDKQIASAIGTAVNRVTTMRREMIAEGMIEPPVSRSIGGRNIGAAARAEEELRRDPARSLAQVAEAAGVSINTVLRTRHRLEAEGAIPRQRARAVRRRRATA